MPAKKITREDGSEVEPEASAPGLDPEFVAAEEAVADEVAPAPRSSILRHRGQRRAPGRLPPANHLPFVLFWTGAYIATDSGSAPDLRQQTLINGVAGVVAHKDGTYDVGGLDDNLTGAGHVGLFDLQHEYCVEIPGHPLCYAEPWAVVQGKEVHHGEARFDAWRKSLIARKIIPAPSEEALRSLIANIDRQIGHKGGTPPEILETLTRRRALIAAELESR